VKAYNAAYRKANKALICERGKAYREANKDALSARATVRHKLKMATDPAYVERCRKSVAAYAERNPEVIRVIRHNRKARIRGAEGTHSAADVAEIMKLQRKRCANPACRAALQGGYHVDHIIPVARGGSNGRRNLQLLCQPCNQRKSAKDPIAWAQENGLLL
jgi:5-methylcytosine-specific restriction endonuclease McrA